MERNATVVDWGDERVYLVELTAGDARRVFGTALPAAGGEVVAEGPQAQRIMAEIVAAGTYRDVGAGTRRFVDADDVEATLPWRLLAPASREICRLSGLDAEVSAKAAAFPDEGGAG